VGDGAAVSDRLLSDGGDLHLLFTGTLIDGPRSNFQAYFHIFVFQLYNHVYNVVRVCEYWMLTWVGVCLVMVQIINDAQQSGLTALMFLMMPLFALTGYLVAERRCQQLLDSHPEDLSFPEEFELKSRFLMADLITQLRLSSTENQDHSSHANSNSVKISPEKIQTIIQGMSAFI
jgi:hypothetical protein